MVEADKSGVLFTVNPQGILNESVIVVGAGTGDQVVEDRELAEMVNRFLHTLGSRDCSVFLRRYWYVEPLEDIGERYGLNVNTVKTILFRTRKS